MKRGRRRAIAGAALLAAGLGVVCGVPLGRREPVATPLRWNGRAAFAARGQGPLRAGAGKVVLPIQPGAPLAGYATIFGRSWDGTGEPLYARAAVLEAGGLRVHLVALDLLLISADLEAEIFHRASLPETSCALVAATHTHSGAGGTWDSAVGAALGNGKFDRATRDGIAQAAADALAQAIAALRPATLRTAQVVFDGGPARPRSGTSIDPGLTAFRIEEAPGGAAIATAAIYGMHPTVHGKRSRRLSGEWPAAAARLLDAGGGVGLVLQGAVGNATWARAGDDEAASIARLGRQVATEALRAALAAPPVGAGLLTCEVRLLPLPPPQASPAVPWPLRRAVANLLGLADPRVVPQVELGLGPLHLLGVPGEPVGPLGLQARPRAALVGLADGYAGYIETAEQVESGAGEAARTSFGPSLAKSLGLGIGGAASP